MKRILPQISPGTSQPNSNVNSTHDPVTSSQISYDKNEVNRASQSDTAKLCMQMRDEIQILINLVNLNEINTLHDCDKAFEYLKQAAEFTDAINHLSQTNINFESIEDLESLVMEKKSILQADIHLDIARTKQASFSRSFISLLELGVPKDDAQLQAHIKALKIGLTLALDIHIELKAAEELNPRLQDNITLQINSDILQFQQTIRYMEAERVLKAAQLELTKTLYSVYDPDDSSVELKNIRLLMQQIKPYIEVREDCKTAYDRLAVRALPHEKNVFNAKAELLRMLIDNHLRVMMLNQRVSMADRLEIDRVLHGAIKDPLRPEIRMALIDATPEEFTQKPEAVSHVLFSYFHQQNNFFCLPSSHLQLDPEIQSDDAKRKIQGAML